MDFLTEMWLDIILFELMFAIPIFTVACLKYITEK